MGTAACRPGTRTCFPARRRRVVVAEETLPEGEQRTRRGEKRRALHHHRVLPRGARGVRVTSNETGFDVPVAVAVCEFLGKVGIRISPRARREDEDEPEDDWFWGDDLAVPKAVRARSPPPSRARGGGLGRAFETRTTSVGRVGHESLRRGSSGAVCVAGRDFVGRRVVTIDAATVGRFDVEGRGRRVLMYAAKAPAPVVSDSRGWTLVYFHSGGRWGAPDVEFVNRLCDALGPGHEETLRMMYIVHPTTMLRAGIWFSVAFGAVSEGVFGKAEYVHRLADLAGSPTTTRWSSPNTPGRTTGTSSKETRDEG